MKKKIIIFAASALTLLLLFAARSAIERSADKLDETTQTDIIIDVTNKNMPEGIKMFPDKDTPAADISPAVWLLTSSDGRHMYMIGTLHYLHKYDYPLPSALQTAYEDCDAVAVEIENVNHIFSEENYLPDPELSKGDTLKAHLTAEQYSLLAEYMSNTKISEDSPVTAENFNTFAPWYIYDNFPTPDEYGTQSEYIRHDYGLDHTLQIQANIDGKQIISVETLESKQTRYSSMPEDIVGVLIKYAVLTVNQNDITENEESYAAWSTGDIDNVYEIASSLDQYTDEEKKIMEEYNKIILDDRNELMADRAIELLNSDKQVLFAVGAAHFGGDKGIVALLQNKGYTVERVQ